MTCAQAKSLFSAYLDGAVTGLQMRQLGEHMAACSGCAGEYAALSKTQSLVSSLGRKKAPPELALRLRVALSQEAAMVRRRRFEMWRLQYENLVRAFMVPATAGVLTAVVVFGLFISLLFALPSQLTASSTDVPTMLYTPPQLVMSPFSNGGISAESVVLEAYIDANGRVQDYRIISAPEGAGSLRPEIENMLIFTVFQPATAFGRPTNGRAILSFSKLTVKG